MIVLLLIYLLLCVSAASWAEKRGRDFWTVFFISIAISPLVVIGSLWTPFKAKKSSLLKE
jgi:predicted membrane channel-forming protein YqfA (hemolysin III family)